MKKVLGSMSKFIFGAFAIAVLGLLMSLTYGALQKLFPDSFANQMWGLVMFDIAAMCWALAFVFQSKSVGQYASAGIGFITAFLGTLLMVAAEVMLSGQTLTQAQTLEIGKWMTYGFIVVTAIHAALVYAHHATAPDIHEQINVGVARGEIVTEAISQATKTLEIQKAELAETIHQDIVSQVKRDLGLYPVIGTPFDTNRLNLDVNMPPDEWQDLEKELQEKGYLEHSNIPAPLTIETKKRTQRKARPWLKNIVDKFKTAPKPVTTYEQTAPAIGLDAWKNSTDISATLDQYAWECLNCVGTNPAHTPTCQWCGQQRTNQSPVTAFSGLPSVSKRQEGAGTAPAPFPSQDTE